MDIALIILIVILSVLLLAVLVSYIAVFYAAYKIKKRAEDFMVNKGKQILNDNVDIAAGKFQKRLIEEVNKKNKK
jgi:uncharacterized protein YpmB